MMILSHGNDESEKDNPVISRDAIEETELSVADIDGRTGQNRESNSEIKGSNSVLDVVFQPTQQFSKIMEAVRAAMIPHGQLEEIQRVQAMINASWTPMLSAMISSVQPKIDYAKLVEPFTQQLNSIFKTLADTSRGVDWEKYRSASRAWGSFGWIIPGPMPMKKMLRAPENQAEADRRCLEYYGEEDLAGLFRDLEKNVRKRGDASEAIWLFRGRHYKPCAMMICSLIEGELIALGNRKNLASRIGAKRGGKSTLRALADCGIPDEGFTALMLENLDAAWNHFFRRGNDFDRSLEGELNRNFLMHGMMYKPVRRKTCIKLFALLDAITSFLPEIADSDYV